MWEKNNDKNLIITDMILGGIIESEDAKFLKKTIWQKSVEIQFYINIFIT